MIAAVCLFLVGLFLDIPGIDRPAEVTLGIFLAAAVCWLFEPIPIYATSLLVIGCQIVFLSHEGMLSRTTTVDLVQPEVAGENSWWVPDTSVEKDHKVESGQGFIYLEYQKNGLRKYNSVPVSYGVIADRARVYSPYLGSFPADSLVVEDVDHWMIQQHPQGFHRYMGSLAHPIIILFLGGFLLATAAVKFKLGRNLTRVLLIPFGNRCAYILLGLMLATALLSAFMSNTATTAMMITVILPILPQLKGQDPFKVGMALGIPVAANIGGIATPIGSPPNAVALAVLSEAGIQISFSSWILLAIPVVLILLFGSWILLLWLYPPEKEEVELDLSGEFDCSRPAIMLYVVFGVTILLWITEKLHGVPSAMIAFIPVAILPTLGIIEKHDIRNLSWEVLWLVAGGISLGLSLKDTGLAEWMILQVQWESFPPFDILVLFALVAVIMANFLSNTVTASLLVPLAMSLGASGVMGDNFVMVVCTVVTIAVASSLGMSLPISTPPNAIAMGTGMIKTPQMLKVGVIVGFVGFIIALVMAAYYWPLVLDF